MSQTSRKRIKNLVINLNTVLLTGLFLAGLTLSMPTLAEGTPPDTAGAQPLEIPLKLGSVSQVAKLIGDDGTDLPGDIDDRFGFSVAVEGDTAVIGIPNRREIQVFTRTLDDWTLQQRIDAADANVDEFFGRLVDLSGETLIASDNNSVHVFVRSGEHWSFEETLNPADLNPIGLTVDIDGDIVIAGSSRADTPAGVDAGSAYIFVRSGTSWSEEVMLTASDASGDDQFGHSVTISGDTVVVGSLQNDLPLGAAAGSAYVFVRSGTSWNEEAMLTASDGTDFDNFGSSVNISGDRLLVGATEDDHSGLENPGSVYVFERSLGAWSEVTRLIASDPSQNADFGASVTLDGDRLTIGGSRNSAYIFEEALGVWSETLRLSAGDPAASERFGSSVAISGDWILVGDPLNNNVGGEDSGATYAFQRTGNTWTEITKLGGIGSASEDAFGNAVAISGRTLVVGSLRDDHTVGANVGSVYVFFNAGNGWQLQAKLTASDGQVGDFFGNAVAIEGDRLVVGASSDDHSGMNRVGSAYIFERSAGIWTEVAKLISGGPGDGERFGTSVALSGDTVIAGAPRHNVSIPGGFEAGKVAVFVRSPDGMWDEEASLIADNFEISDRLGTAVAISGDLVVAGAPLTDLPFAGGDNGGSVSVFERSAGAWTEIDVLFGSNSIGGNRFGDEDLAIAGDIIVASSSRYKPTPESFNGGTVYIFERSGNDWLETTTLIPSDPVMNGRFGTSFAFDNDLLAVAAPGALGVADDRIGAVYLFSHNDGVWTPEDRLTATDAADGDVFGDDAGSDDIGNGVAISVDKIVVGARGVDIGSVPNAGAAYVFVVTDPLFSDGFESGDFSAWTGN